MTPYEEGERDSAIIAAPQRRTIMNDQEMLNSFEHGQDTDVALLNIFRRAEMVAKCEPIRMGRYGTELRLYAGPRWEYVVARGTSLLLLAKDLLAGIKGDGQNFRPRMPTGHEARVVSRWQNRRTGRIHNVCVYGSGVVGTDNGWNLSHYHEAGDEWQPIGFYAQPCEWPASECEMLLELIQAVAGG